MKELSICLSLLAFLINCLAATSEVCNELKDENLESYSNCETHLIENNGYLQTQCLVYALTENQFSILPNSVVGILVSSTFRTKLPLTLTKGSFPKQCVKIANGFVKKYSPENDQNLVLLSNRYVINQVALIPLMAVKQLDFSVRFRAETTVGALTYDADCIQKLIAKTSGKVSGGNLVVSECIRNVEVMERVAMPANALPQNFDITQLIGSDVLTSILNYINEIWLKEYDGTIQSLTLTLNDGFAFPKEALSLLSQRKIEALYLPNNGFESIGARDIPDIPTLKVLDLSNCRLNRIHPTAFDVLPNLEQLNLAGNYLSEIPISVANLNKLEVLNFSSNNRGKNGGFNFASNILSKLINLRVLDLSKTKLSSNEKIATPYSGNADFKLERFAVLNISETDFEAFSKNFQNVFPNLQHLMASGNRLGSEQAKSIVENQWKDLLTLDLSANRLTYDSDFNWIFRRFPRLKHLNLSRNRIGQILSLRIPSESESDFRFVNLSTNGIYTWFEPALNLSNSSTLEMDLSQNNITEVSAGMLNDFSKLEFLHLERNPFDCNSCLLESFQRWMSQTKSLKDNASHYTCAFPKETAGKFLDEIVVDPSLCIFDWILLVLVPVIVVFTFTATITALVYYYRWYIRYFWHLFWAKIEAARNLKGEMEQLHRYDAFVSYCSHDENWVVQQLIPNIEQKEPKLHLCVHARDFAIGGTIINNVIDCIDSSRKSIFLISRNFIQSEWCQWELQMAQHKLFEEKKDVLVLVMLEELEDSQIPHVLKRLISTRTYILYPDPSNAAAYKLFWSRLKRAIGQCRCMHEQIKEYEDQLLA